MNKTMQKMMMVIAVCGALATAAQAGSRPMGAHADQDIRRHGGTVMAVAKTNQIHDRKMPAEKVAPAKKAHVAKAPVPVKHKEKVAPAKKVYVAKAPVPVTHRERSHVAPAKPAPKHEVVKRIPPPPPHEKNHNKPRPNDHHCHDTLHTEDWCTIGASLIGGMLGGIIGASI